MKLKPLFEKIKNEIEARNQLLVTTHIHPDGDSIASVLSIGFLLQYIQKDFIIVLHDELPKKFDFLPGIDQIKHIDEFEPDFKPSLVIIVDSSDLNRIGDVKKIITEDTFLVNIDHHPSNRIFGHINVIDPKESSTVEIVYRLLDWWGIPVTEELASLIYTGIICDTGRFLFPNTTQSSLEICSKMIQAGACPDHIAKNVYFRTSQCSMKALAKALASLEFHMDGRVTCMHLAYEDLPANGKLDTEGFVDYLMSIEGTEIQFFMMEKQPGLFKISFRSQSMADVNKIAKSLGGGGHIRASGCHIEGGLDNVRNQIIQAIQKQLI